MKKILIILVGLLTCLAVTLTVISGAILFSKMDRVDAPQKEPLLIATEPAIETEAPEPSTEETLPPATVTPIETREPEPTEAETQAPTEEILPAGYTAVDRTVYATQNTNVRSGPSLEHDKIGTLPYGDSVRQLAYGKNGWSKVVFEGEEAYIFSKYLRTQPTKPTPRPTEKPAEKPQENKKDPVFEDVNDVRYTTGSLNVRSGPGVNYKAIGSLKAGAEIRRVAVSDTGWSKIRFNNAYAYVYNQYLTAEKPQEKPVSPNVTYEDVDEIVYATDTLHLRTGPGTNHKSAAKLQPGDSIRRTAIGSNGWSEVRYEGSRLYASSQYLTRTAPEDSEEETEEETQGQKPDKPQKPAVKLTEVDDHMVASQDLTLRSGPGVNYKTMGTLSKGQLVHRTATTDNGWSRILLGGREVFVETAYLEEEKKPQKPDKEEAEEETEDQQAEDDGFSTVEEVVYATDNLNVRSGPGTHHKRIGRIPKGEAVDRIAVGDMGWSRILYDGNQAYVSSAYLKTREEEEEETEQTFREVDETVYSVDEVHVRAKPSTDSRSLGKLFYGDSIRRIGIGNMGWSQVDFDGEEAYVYSKYLSTEEPVIPDFGETTSPDFPTPNSPFIYQYLDTPELIPFAVFEPVSSDGSHKLPLIISLHGSMEVGKNRDFFQKQHVTNVLREWEYTELEPFKAFVICPHLAKDVPITTWATREGADALFDIIDYMIKNYEIDEDRIILEGHSMGGQGALWMAADERACFSKLVLISALDAGIDYDQIDLPVKGCVGGGPDSPGEKDSPYIYKFMMRLFTDYFPREDLYIGNYNHDNVAIEFFQKDEDGDGRSDIIDWMLN